MLSITDRALARLAAAEVRLLARGRTLNYRSKDLSDWNNVLLRGYVAIAGAEYLLELTGYRPPQREPEQERIARNLLVEHNAFAQQLGGAQFTQPWRSES